MTFAIAKNGGHTTWSQAVDNEGNREYRIIFRVETDDPLDGPGLARLTPGLPVIGSSWQFDNESDPWAFCLPGGSTVPVTEPGEPCTVFDVEFIFSSKPPPQNQQRCNDQKIEDPLLEPPRLSGGSTKYSEEAAQDRFGQFVCSSSFEPIRGQVNEWDANRSSIRIEMNVASFAQVQLALAMRDCVNILPLWGFARRCVKLSNVTWERKYYGFCYQYYSLSMEFDTNPRTFDRDILDEGHKCLKGHWDAATGYYYVDKIGTGANERDPSRFNPSDFIRIPDREGNPSRMLLNGFGLPAAATIRIQLSAGTPAEYGLTTTRYMRGQAADGADILPPPMMSGSVLSSYSGARRWMAIANFADWTSLGGSDIPPSWNGDQRYVAGDVVIGGGRFLCLSACTGDPPPSANWLSLGTLVYRGVWVSGTTDYVVGNYVQMATSTDPVGTGYQTFQTGIGVRHVEVYSEANFLALGIPAYL